MKYKTTQKPMLTVMVPVYNEEKTLEKILTVLLRLPIDKYEVIVVDDYSKDSSPKIIKEVHRRKIPSNVTFKHIRHKVNQGKGAAIKSALKEATGTYFVVQDADLEYDPNDIPPLLESALKNDYSVVYGSRFLGTIKNMPKPNYYANNFYNFLIRSLYNVQITDMHTCYKMVKTGIMKDLDMTSDGFDYATELVSKLLKRKYTIHELPIKFNGRTKKQGKKINYNDGIECTYQIFKYKFSRAKNL